MAEIPTRDTPTSSAQLLELMQLKALFQTYPDYVTTPKHAFSTKGDLIIRVALVWMFLALMAVGARLFLRARWKGLKMGWDDWLMIPSTVLALVLTVVQIAAVTEGGLGRHVYDNTYHEIGVSLKLIFVHIIVYLWAVTFTKASILLFVWRLAPPTSIWLRRAIMGFVGLHFVLLFVACLLFGLECHPNAAAWDINVLVRGTRCMNLPAIMLTLNALFVISDACVMMLPVRMIWQLRMPERMRFAIVGLFSMGIFVCICCIMKMVYFRHYYESYDLTYNGANALIWGHLEATIGIVTASLPTLNVMFVKMVPEWFKGPMTLEYNRSLTTDLEQAPSPSLKSPELEKPSPKPVFAPLKQIRFKHFFDTIKSAKFRRSTPLKRILPQRAHLQRILPKRAHFQRVWTPLHSQLSRMRLRHKFKRLSRRRWSWRRPNPWRRSLESPFAPDEIFKTKIEVRTSIYSTASLPPPPPPKDFARKGSYGSILVMLEKE